MSDPDLSAEEQQVRRLLADARHDQPLPDDVAARLDEVLADLGTRSTVAAPVVDLAARRRRRARTLLIAAAAVVVLGVGIKQVDLGGSGDADSGASGPESSALDDSAGGDAAGPGSHTRGVLRLRADDFDEQIARLDARQGLTTLSQRSVQQFGGDDGLTGGVAGWCDDPAWGPGERIAVRYDAQRGVLVLRDASDGSRDVDLFLCGESAPSRSTTVPAG